MDLTVVTLNPVFKAAVAGTVAAAAADVHAFVKFQQWSEFAEYSWSTASLRWFIGAVVGAATALGYGYMFG